MLEKIRAVARVKTGRICKDFLHIYQTHAEEMFRQKITLEKMRTIFFADLKMELFSS